MDFSLPYELFLFKLFYFPAVLVATQTEIIVFTSYIQAYHFDGRDNLSLSKICYLFMKATSATVLILITIPSPYKEIFVIFHRRLKILPEFCHNVSRLKGDRDILALSMVCSTCLKPFHDFSIFGEKVEGAAIDFGDAPRHQNVAVVETPDLWSHTNKPRWGPC